MKSEDLAGVNTLRMREKASGATIAERLPLPMRARLMAIAARAGTWEPERRQGRKRRPRGACG
ncbi:MAG: hypothetical protein OXG72_13195 [Acidobacteria bacterium]|nr:hypothetical protein [Acidobacteriota bacterium]